MRRRQPDVMNTGVAHSVAKNTMVQFGQQMITWLSSFLLMLFLPRMLGPVSYGHIYLATTISAIFLMVIDWDGRIGIAKRVAKAPKTHRRSSRTRLDSGCCSGLPPIP